MAVVLHVHGDRGARRAGRRADAGDVLCGRLLAMVGQAQADRARLDGHLRGGTRGEPSRLQAGQQGGVLAGGRVRLPCVPGVLAQVVQGDEQPRLAQLPGHRDGVGGRVTGHVAGHDTAAHRRRCDELTHPAAIGGGQQNAAQHGHSPLGSGRPPPVAALPAAGLRYPRAMGRPAAGSASAGPARGTGAGQLPGRASALRRLSVTLTFAPASGGTTTSWAAGTPPARSAASTGTVRLIRPSPTGPSSKCRAAEPTNPTTVSSRVTGSPSTGSRSSLPPRWSRISRRGGWPTVGTRATV